MIKWKNNNLVNGLLIIINKKSSQQLKNTHSNDLVKSQYIQIEFYSKLISSYL